MVTGVGTPLTGFTRQALEGKQGFSLPENTANPLQNSNDILNISADDLILDEAGKAALESIQNGIQQLRETDLSLAKQRLSAVQERLSVTSRLARLSGPENVSGFLQDAQSIGRELASLGRQIGFALGEDFIRFQSFSAEFSSLQAVSVQESLSVSVDQDGVEIRQSLEASALIASSLQIEQGTTLSAGDIMGDQGLEPNYEGLIKAFATTISDFNDFAGGFFG